LQPIGNQFLFRGLLSQSIVQKVSVARTRSALSEVCFKYFLCGLWRQQYFLMAMLPAGCEMASTNSDKAGNQHNEGNQQQCNPRQEAKGFVA